MIQLESVTLAYNENTVPIENFSYEFENGVYFISGASGCGKSTLLKGIAGLIKTQKGTIDTQNQKIAMVFQENRLIESYSVYENLKLIVGKSESIDEILMCVGLHEYQNKAVSKLSGGQQRRVALARAVLYGGDCIILDEPFEGLDIALRITIAKIIRERFSLIIVSSHDIQDAMLLAKDADFHKICLD